MALYEYRCKKCEQRFELMRRVADRDKSATCPECGSRATARQKFQAFALRSGASPDAAAGEGAWREAEDLARPGDLLVLNKRDLGTGADREAAEARGAALGVEALAVSAATGEGLDALLERITAKAIALLSGGEFPAATRARHRASLADAHDHVGRALAALDDGPELAAEDLRLAARALGRITGRIDPDQVLDRIFASFCIGK